MYKKPEAHNYIIRLNDDNISTMNFRWNKSAEYKSWSNDLSKNHEFIRQHDRRNNSEASDQVVSWQLLI